MGAIYYDTSEHGFSSWGYTGYPIIGYNLSIELIFSNTKNLHIISLLLALCHVCLHIQHPYVVLSSWKSTALQYLAYQIMTASHCLGLPACWWNLGWGWKLYVWLCSGLTMYQFLLVLFILIDLCCLSYGWIELFPPSRSLGAKHDCMICHWPMSSAWVHTECPLGDVVVLTSTTHIHTCAPRDFWIYGSGSRCSRCPGVAAACYNLRRYTIQPATLNN